MFAVGVVSLFSFVMFAPFASATTSVIHLTSPAGSEIWSGTHDITWTYDNNSGSTGPISILLSTNGGSYSTLVTGVNVASTTYPWDTKDVSDGTTYKIKVADFSPGVGVGSASPNTFTVDNTPPTFGIVDGTATGPVKNDTIKVTVADATSGVNTSTLEYGFATAGSNNSVDCSGANYAKTSSTNNTFTSGQDFTIAGDHTDYLCVKATDNAGNTGYKNVGKLNTDNTVPAVVVAPSSGSYLSGTRIFTFKATDPNLAYLGFTMVGPSPYTSNQAIQITFAPNASDPYQTYDPATGVYTSYTQDMLTLFGEMGISVTYNSSTQTWTMTIDTTKKWTTSTWSLSLNPWSQTQGSDVWHDGQYTFTTDVGDLAGNVLTGTYNYTFDNTAPTIDSFTSPAADKVYESTTSGGDTTDALSFKVSDTGTGALTCSYNIDNSATSTTPCSNGTDISNATISGLTDGRHTITFSVADAAGNTAYSSPVPFVFDNNNTLTVSNNKLDNADFATIAEAVSKATAGDTISIAAGNYPETLNLEHKSLTLTGAGIGNTTIDASALPGRAIYNFGDNSTVKDLTLKGNNSGSGDFGFKIAEVSGIILKNIEVENSGGAGIDLNGVDGGTLDKVTVTDSANDFGINLVDSSNITLTDITTNGNANGGVSVQSKGEAYAAGSDGINFSDALNTSEPAPLLLQEYPCLSSYPSGNCTVGDYSDITDLTAPSNFGYVVYALMGGTNYKQWFYQTDLANAEGVAQQLEGSSYSYSDITISNIAKDNYYVFPGMKIQNAIDAAAAGSTINVEAGSYDENINIDKALTLDGTNATVDPNSTSWITTDESIISPTSGTAVTVASNGVTIDGFTITNGGAAGTGIYSSDNSNLTIKNNIITNIGNSSNDVVGRGIEVVSTSKVIDTVLITNNKIDDITSGLWKTGDDSTSASAISVGWSNGEYDIKNLSIKDNVITDINANTSSWDTATKGQGAYGILLNLGADNDGGKVVAPQITGNTINTLDGLWAHAIGLEGDTPGATITGNIISGLIGHKSGTDDVGVILQDNTGAGTVVISKNQFASNIIGVKNLLSDSNIGTTTATENWWGSIQGPATTTNPHGDGARVYGMVAFTPWCTDASCSTVGTAPTADITNPPANPTNDASPSFTVGSTSGDVVYYKYQLGSGTWSGETAVGTPIALTSLVSGSYTLNVVGRDQAGNWQATTSPTTYTWTVDTVAPTLSSVSITSSNTTTTLAKEGDIVTLNFTTSEAIDTPVVKIDGQSVTAVASSTSVTNGWTASYVMASTDTQGTIPLTIDFTDFAGNPGTQVTATDDNSAVFYDRVAPSVSAGSNEDVNAQVTQTSASASDGGSGIASILWSEPSAISFDTANDVNTKISATTDGTYELTLTVTDKAGNTSSDTMQFTWDTTNPFVLTSAPVGGAQNVSSADGSATVVFNESVQNLNTSKVNLVDNATGVSVAGAITLSGSTITIPYTGLTADTTYRINVAPGAVKDMAGNNLTTNFVSSFKTSVTPDTTAPDAPVITTSTPASTVNANFYTITGTDASDGGQRIINLYNGTTLAGTAVLVAGNTGWTIVAPLTQGSANKFTATATDGAGNVSSASNSVTITEAAPTSVIPKITLIGNAIAPSYTATEAAARFGSGLQFTTTGASVTVNGTSVTSGTTITAASLLDATTLGLHVYNVVVTSSTGNTANITVWYQVGADITLAVTGIDAIKTYATADDTYANGWSWKYHITVPTNETTFSMKFSDFVSGANSIPAKDNIQFYTAQASAHADEAHAVQILNAGDPYSATITLDSDSEPGTPGRQIDVVVEMKVPTNSAGGSYSGSYGVKTI